MRDAVDQMFYAVFQLRAPDWIFASSSDRHLTEAIALVMQAVPFAQEWGPRDMQDHLIRVAEHLGVASVDVRSLLDEVRGSPEIEHPAVLPMDKRPAE